MQWELKDMFPLAQVDAALKAIDHAAAQGENWILIAVVVGMAIAMVWKARIDQRRQDEMAKRLDQVQDEHTTFLQSSNDKLVTSMDRNSSAMLEFSHSLSSISRVLEGHSRTTPNLP